MVYIPSSPNLQGKYDEADPLYVRAIAIGEKALGRDDPDLAVYLNNRAELLRAQVSGVTCPLEKFP